MSVPKSEIDRRAERHKEELRIPHAMAIGGSPSRAVADSRARNEWVETKR